MRLIRKSDYRVMPWKNGGGSTTEIYVAQSGVVDFDWRVSIATVSTDGPFSIFAGFDRHIMMLEGNGMTLEVADQGAAVLAPLTPFSFSGDAVVSGRLNSGPVKDFNLMVRRDFGFGNMRVLQTVEPCRLGGGSSQHLIHTLHKDSVLLATGEAHAFAAGETLVVCEVSPHSRRGPGA
jgi:uncharacterized protein